LGKQLSQSFGETRSTFPYSVNSVVHSNYSNGIMRSAASGTESFFKPPRTAARFVGSVPATRASLAESSWASCSRRRHPFRKDLGIPCLVVVGRKETAHQNRWQREGQLGVLEAPASPPSVTAWADAMCAQIPAPYDTSFARLVDHPLLVTGPAMCGMNASANEASAI
jgi:hypothetical protein